MTEAIWTHRRRRAGFTPLAATTVLALGIGLLLMIARPARAIPIAGANGRVVEFAGIKSAGPGGLQVQIQAGGELIQVSWDKLDLGRLQAEQPAIHAAFEAAKRGQSTDLNLGSFAPGTPTAPTAPTLVSPEEIAKVPGRYSTSAGGAQFVLQLAGQDPPRAVLLLAIGQDGRSLRYLGGPDNSRWSVTAKKLKLAVLAYEFPAPKSGSPQEAFKTQPFIYADQGSGEAVLKALESFAQLTKKPELATAPIAVFGQDVQGAAFAFNFSQAYPDRVIAATAVKGAFYAAKPTEASAKVPLLILWGEYDEDINLWQPTFTHQSVYPSGLPLKANWTYAMEPRTGSGETPHSHYFALTFLDRMILARLDAEGKMQDLDRSRAFVGDLNQFKISRLEDVESVLTDSQTWLPDGEIGKLWEDFSNGALVLPAEGKAGN